MSKYTYLDFITEVLHTSQRPLQYKEIWLKGVELGLDKKLGSMGKTPAHTIAAYIYTNLKKSDSLFLIASKKPTTFWLKERERELLHKNFDEISSQEESSKQKREFKERDLHPLLVKFLYESKEFDLYTKTIYHEKSQKTSAGQKISGRDKWNYPDIVGIHFPFSNYRESVIELLASFNKSSYKLYSFELKVALEWGNLKESYFQAVSNSSWANEGYLVVFEDIDGEIFDEIIRLNASFGIGVIQLECDSISSRVLLPARQREIDIETLNMLAEKNKDFRDFIENINKDMRTKDKERIAQSQYDNILDDVAMQEYISKKKITKIRT